MLQQRRQKIIEYIKKNQNASLDELCETFKVSKNTIRRDIEELQDKGIVEKVYGGVVLKEMDKAVSLSIRQSELSKEKEMIGLAASKLVDDNDIIAIDAGSTTVHMVKYLRDKNNITIVTNSLSVINEAMEYKNLNIIATGGSLLRDTYSFVGFDAITVIESLNVKKAFIAATGVSINKGLTNASVIESHIKKAIAKSAEDIILMADSSKFGVISLSTFYNLKGINKIITDLKPNEEYIEYFNNNNIQIIIAKQEEE